MKHSATPWVRDGTIMSPDHLEIDLRLDDKGENWITIKGDKDKVVEANAEFIVRAVNSHEELVEACIIAEQNLSPIYSSDHLVIKSLRQAIAKAEKHP